LFVWQHPEEAAVRYISTLNVPPAFQNKSLARKFLTHFVERTAAEGAVRLDLNTWSGNIKAVPLYKKCGFMWRPGTSVRMNNFIPAILNMPLAQSFFQKHDWYRSYQRELTQAEDDERWQGMDVYTYHFAAEGDELTVWIDPESRTVMGIETNELIAAALTDDSRPPRGLPTTIRWQLRNKRAMPLQVSLFASGTEHLKLDYRATFQLAEGESLTLEAPVQVTLSAPELDPDKPVPALRTLMVLDGKVLELGAGLRPRAAVEISTEPGYFTLTPGVPEKVQLQLKSNLLVDAVVTVGVVPAEGLSGDWTQQTITLPAGDYVGLPITLSAERAGIYQLPMALAVELNGETLLLPPKPYAVFVLPMGGVLGAQVGDTVRIENEMARLVLLKDEAAIKIYDRLSGELLVEHIGYAAPPVRPSEFWNGPYDLSIEQSGDKVVATTSMASQEYPGFVMRKHVTVNASSTFTIDYNFENLGVVPRTLHLHGWVEGDQSRSLLTLPLAAGLARASWENFPGITGDEFNKPENFAEPWAALEFAQATVGVIWGQDMAEIEWSMFSTHPYTCAPQSRTHPQSMHIYVGDGGWQAVQRLARRLRGQQTERQVVEPRSVLTARVEPVVVTASDTAQATLVVEHLMNRAIDGTATLTLPKGWHADVTTFNLHDVNWQQPRRSTVHFTTDLPGATSGRLVLNTTDRDLEVDVPLIRLGDGSSVEVLENEQAGQRVLTIDNGRLQLDVTPDFGGTVTGLREGDTNHLLSAFPEARPFGWMSPWFGGLQPVMVPKGVWDFPGKLSKEKFAAEPVTSIDSAGIVWSGVRQRTTITREEFRGLVLEIDAVTVGGSPVVKLVWRLINPLPYTFHLGETGWMCFVQPDGDREHTTIWGAEDQFKPSDRIAWVQTDHWAAAHNPKTGRALALVSPQPIVRMAGWSSEGNHIDTLVQPTVPGGGMWEATVYLVLTDDLATVKRYAALKYLH
jgi:hypothetical protein